MHVIHPNQYNMSIQKVYMYLGVSEGENALNDNNTFLLVVRANEGLDGQLSENDASAAILFFFNGSLG